MYTAKPIREHKNMSVSYSGDLRLDGQFWLDDGQALRNLKMEPRGFCSGGSILVTDQLNKFKPVE